MAIQFTLTLSINQIACLRAIQKNFDGESDVLGEREISFFFSGTRLLRAEKLVEYYPYEGRVTPPDWKHWRITEKGRLVLRVIELDVEDFAKSITHRENRILEEANEKSLATEGGK